MMSILKKIAADLAMPVDWVMRIIQRSPYSYKTYFIKKKTGGLREISQPSRETKALQYWVIDNVISKLPIHEVATAYTKGSSILKNASAHKDNRYMAKFDFKDFFPCITANDFKLHIEKYYPEKIEDDDVQCLQRICFKRGFGDKILSLTIGAPSSPSISNTIMYDFDCILSNYCNDRSITYTRYADDLVFSTNISGNLFDLDGFIRSKIKEIKYPSLSINEKKTVFVSKKFQRRVTGLIITNENSISLGRDKKREISSLVHKHSLGLIDRKEVIRLKGLLGFAKNVEPEFILRLTKKYGVKILDSILSFDAG